MEGNYSVYFGNLLAGKVQVVRQGLYYRFVCRCQISGDVMCRLLVSCGNQSVDLGVVVPVDGGFGLNTRIPMKRLGEGQLKFLLRPKHDIKHVAFVPVYPEEPFAYIERLKEGFLSRQDGQIGVLFGRKI